MAIIRNLVVNDMTDKVFWEALDTLVSSSRLVIDRPIGSHHPRFPEVIYPVDYGYLENTTSMDGHGIDVWCGTEPSGKIDAIICTIDLLKKDSEIKLLMGCTATEKKNIMDLHNQGNLMKGIFIERSST